MFEKIIFGFMTSPNSLTTEWLIQGVNPEVVEFKFDCFNKGIKPNFFHRTYGLNAPVKPIRRHSVKEVRFKFLIKWLSTVCIVHASCIA